MKILFVHQNFPAQYCHIVPALLKQGGHEIVALYMNDVGHLPGVTAIRHGANIAKPSSHPYLSLYEDNIQRGHSAAQALEVLRERGFVPDLICAHPGWGEALFLKAVFPTAKLLCYQEFYYRSAGSDVDFDPEYMPTSKDYILTTPLRNSTILQSLALADFNISPTHWQKIQFPEVFQSRIKVLHDGIDTTRVKPDHAAFIELAGRGVRLTVNDEVITFVNRNLEPYRGFHIFMRTLPALLRARPKAHVLIVGGDDVSYGRPLASGQTYRQKYMAEVGEFLDLQRVHFVGRIPYPVFINLLQISSVHIYLTYPFVLSWSLLEAMSAGCAIVGSATPPVLEVVRHEENGLLVDFFSPEQIVAAVDRVLDHPDRMADMRARARDFVIKNYDLHQICLPAHLDLIAGIAAGKSLSDL
jgi:glycosyltransferase involved in cell wall biosynthesis